VPGSSTILDGGGSDTDRSAGSHMTIRVHHTAPNRPPGDDFSLELDPASCTPARLVWQRPATLSDLVREQGSLRPEDRVPLSQLAARLAASSGTRSESIELSGYRSASGLQIPFVWSRAVDGRIIEQWQVDDVEINPHLEPNYFATTSTN
jgi:hypothetical protein